MGTSGVLQLRIKLCQTRRLDWAVQAPASMTFWTLLPTPRADADPEDLLWLCGGPLGAPAVSSCLDFFPPFKEHLEVPLIVVLAFFQPPNIKYQ